MRNNSLPIIFFLIILSYQSIIKNISGHSMRVGAAQDLMLSKTSFPIIMDRGRWSKIDTVMRYIEFNSHIINN